MSRSGKATTRAGRTSMVPDGAIRAYFALFPVVVALFLSVQAVRAHELGADAAKQVAAQAAAVGR